MPRFLPTGEIEFPFEEADPIGDENKKRGNWTTKMDFILSSLGFTIGLGNLWRFPYYCFINGGSAFLIAYLLMFLIAGLPMFFMEFALGQFASLGCISVWKVCPLFQGVGVAMFIVSCLISTYYNVITSWSMFYLAASIRSTVPWATCNNWWNTKNCLVWSRQFFENCTRHGGFLLQTGACRHPNDTFADFGNTSTVDGVSSSAALTNRHNRTLPSDEYFHNFVLQISSGIDSVGTVHWQLAITLLIAWLLVFFCLFNGIKSAGKVVYIIVVLPFIILLVLFVHGLTLPGGLNGLLQLLTPNFHRLADVKVWGDAAAQVFFSLCICWGGLSTLASYNKFHNNCYKDMWIVAFGDLLSSIFASLVVFTTVGFMAFQLDKSVASVLKPDAGLAFIVYAEAIARLPVAPVWAILFFSVLIMLGICSQVFVTQTIVTAVCDEFPEKYRKNQRHVLALVIVIFLIAGVPFCTEACMYMVQLLDYFTARWSVVVIAFFECLAVAWVYGADNLLDNIKWMTRFYPKPYVYWKISWKFITPLILLTVMLFLWTDYKPLAYSPYNEAFPPWASIVGWIVSFVPIAAIPLTAIYKLCRAHGSFPERVRDLLSPDDDWGPALAIHRAEIFPVEVYEARQPIKLVDGETPMSNGVHERSPTGDDYDDQVKLLLSNGIPKSGPAFDKETVI